MVERPCWLCSLTLEFKALREALTTGGEALHSTAPCISICAASPHKQSYLAPASIASRAIDYAFGHDPNSDSEDEVDIRGSLSFPPRERSS
jgi:hypothetical protein